MNIEIDRGSGYCFGVEFAVQLAEEELNKSGTLYCLGDIVHNRVEVERLKKKGLKVITLKEMEKFSDCKVLIRAHGEAPKVYELAYHNRIQLIDASCPVVLKLQHRIRFAYDKVSGIGGQLVIYGRKDHPEIIGLNGQIDFKGIVISSENEVDSLDFLRPVCLFSQTTKMSSHLLRIRDLILEGMRRENPNFSPDMFEFHQSICRQVSSREPRLRTFSRTHDVILFVAGKKSSNGKALYNVCKEENRHSYFIESFEELDMDVLSGSNSVGICGATSTPQWLMQDVADRLDAWSIRYSCS